MFRGFPKDLVKSVVCQKDNGSLIVEQSEEDEKFIINGLLKCQQCGCQYQIKDGVLNLLKKQKPLDDILLAEIKARDLYAENYNRKLAIRHHKEVPSALKHLGNIAGKKIIEYACGTGRFTIEIASQCQAVLAVDFSYNSLLWLAKNLQYDNVGLVLADAIQLKTASNYFDLALSTQFLEHIPIRQQRLDFLQKVHKTLKDKGIFVCSVYHQDLRRLIKKQPQQGYHPSGIFYYYFKPKEIRQEFKNYFKVLKLHPIDITLPLEARFNLTGLISGRIFERIPLINKLGHLLIIKTEKY